MTATPPPSADAVLDAIHNLRKQISGDTVQVGVLKRELEAFETAIAAATPQETREPHWKREDGPDGMVRFVRDGDIVRTAVAATSMQHEAMERLLAAFKGLQPFPLVVQAIAEGLIRDAEAALASATTPAVREATIEQCAKLVEPKGPCPCQCEECWCGDSKARTIWDRDLAHARAIRSLSVSRATAGSSGQ